MVVGSKICKLIVLKRKRGVIANIIWKYCDSKRLEVYYCASIKSKIVELRKIILLIVHICYKFRRKRAS